MKKSKYEVLLTVYEYKNITKAAEALNYTQSGVSQIISSLEKEIGFPLVVRTKGGVKITESGQRIYEPLVQLVKWERILNKTANSIIGLEEGIIKIGIFSSVAMQWLPCIVTEFAEKYPNVKYQSLFGNYQEIEEMLHNDVIDCGFTVDKYNKDLAFIPLIEDEFIVVAPKDHHFAKLKSVPIHMLNNEDFIYPAEGEDFDLGSIFKDNKINVNVRFISADDYSIVALVEKGLGCCILPQLVLDGIEGEVIFRPLREHYYRTLGIAVNNLQYLSPLSRAFLDFIVDWVAKHYR